MFPVVPLSELSTLPSDQPRYGVIGHPVAHSLSPQMQLAAFAACELTASYVRIDIPPDQLPSAVQTLRDLNFSGWNCTLPHKVALANLVDELADSAQAMRAVNTVLRDESGRLIGFNTDGDGWVRAIRDVFYVDVRDLRILILGAGGTGQALARQAALEKCERLVIANRSPEKTEALRAELEPLFHTTKLLGAYDRFKILPLDEATIAAELNAIDLVVNTTSLGLRPGNPPRPHPPTSPPGLRHHLPPFQNSSPPRRRRSRLPLRQRALHAPPSRSPLLRNLDRPHRSPLRHAGRPQTSRRVIPEWFPWLAAFLIGACIGSFLNVCIYRWPLGRSVIRPNSHCHACGAPIPARHNLPILSWFLLRGRAACCGVPLDARYPLVEAITALLFTILWILWPPQLAAPYCLGVAGLIIATFVDLDHYIIPDEVSLGGVLVGLILSTLIPDLHQATSWWGGLKASLLGVAVGGGALWAIAFLGSIIFRKEAMGMGDIKLLAAMGAFLGWTAVPFIIGVASMLGAVIGACLLLRKNKLWGVRLPFGPFLAAAALLWLLGGHQWMADYLALFTTG
ncbi:MAG: prepilin peptidase [Verrucomicrobiia bacterium]